MIQPYQFQVRASIERFREDMDDFSELFFEGLFERAPETRSLFRNEDVRRSKLRSMLSTLANCRDLKKLAPTFRRLGERHNGYGVVRADYQPLIDAIEEAVARVDPQGGDEKVRVAWRVMLEAIIELMAPMEGERQLPAQQEVTTTTEPTESGATLYAEVGGYEGIERVHTRFYQTIFADAWLGEFFAGKSLTSLVLKQSRFMETAFGGPDHYQWESPAQAHMHMYITDEQADIREVFLRNAIREEGFSDDIEARWLAVDQSFRPAVVKQEIAECSVRCPGQVPISARRPAGYRPPALIPRAIQKTA